MSDDVSVTFRCRLENLMALNIYSYKKEHINKELIEGKIFSQSLIE